MRRGLQWSALVGGSAWVVHAAFELFEPLGRIAEHQSGLGYSTIPDLARFGVYAAPGTLAIVLTAVVLLGVTRDGQAGRAAQITAYLAALVAAAAMLGAGWGLTSGVAEPWLFPLFLSTLVLSLGAIFVGAARAARIGADIRAARHARRLGIAAGSIVAVTVGGITIVNVMGAEGPMWPFVLLVAALALVAVGTIVAGVAGRAYDQLTAAWITLGGLGLIALPARTSTWMLGMPEPVAFVVFAAFGLAWLWVGTLLGRQAPIRPRTRRLESVT